MAHTDSVLSTGSGCVVLRLDVAPLAGCANCEARTDVVLGAADGLSRTPRCPRYDPPSVPGSGSPVCTALAYLGVMLLSVVVGAGSLLVVAARP